MTTPTTGMRFLVEVEINGRLFRRELRTDDADAMITATTKVSGVLSEMSHDIFDELLHLNDGGSTNRSVAGRVERERARHDAAQEAAP